MIAFVLLICEDVAMLKGTLIVRWLYSVLLTLLLPFIFLWLFWRGRKNPDYRQRWAERLGIFKPPAWTGAVWIHAVSFGEAIAAISIIKAFQKQYPEIPLVITTTTPTGSKQIQTQLMGASHSQPNNLFHVYFPYDLPWTFTRFLKRLRPRLCVIMETELWPNCLQVCRKFKLPVIIANARLSFQSMKKYQWIKPIMREMLSSLACVAAQSQRDGEHYLSLGLPPQQLQIMGNVKYDLTLPEGLTEQASIWRAHWGQNRPVFIAASTHAPEEEEILKAFVKIKEQHKDTLLIIVPRHRHRFSDVADKIRQQGFSLVTRSSGVLPDASTEVFLGDTMGEMLLFYAVSDIAFVGGSFAPVGGHNTLEPSAFGVPSIVGPHVHNFTEITATLKAAGALQQVQDGEALVAVVNDWLNQPEKRRQAGDQGKKTVAENRGAIQKLLGLMQPYL